MNYNLQCGLSCLFEYRKNVNIALKKSKAWFSIKDTFWG